MNKNLICLLLTAVVGSSVLTGCGEELIAAPTIAGYNQDQIQLATQNTTPATAQNTVKSPAKTTKTPAKTTTKTGTTTKTPAKTTTKTPAATTTDVNSSLSVAQKLILKSKQTYDGLKSYSATITMFSKRNDKTVPNGQPTITTETKYLFQPPRNQSFNVIKHSISMVVGAKMVWTGASSAKVKAGGVLGMFPLDLKLTDSKLTTNRNWQLDNLDHVGILSRALDKKAVLSLVGKSTINGKEAYMVKVEGTGLDPEVTEENIAIDVKTFTIIADEMYAGKDLVFQTKINIDGINVTIPADAFTV